MRGTQESLATLYGWTACIVAALFVVFFFGSAIVNFILSWVRGVYVAAKLEEQIKKEGAELNAAWETEMQETWGNTRDTNNVDDLIDVQHDPADTSKVKIKGKDILDKVKKPLDKLKKPFQNIGDKLSR